MKCRMKRWVVALTAVAISVIAVPAASAATQNWVYASASSPQFVSGYGSWAKTYGTLKVSRLSNTSARVSLVSTYYKYYDSYDHKVYVSMQYKADKPMGSAGGAETNHGNLYRGVWTVFGTLPSKVAWSESSAKKLHTIEGSASTCLDIPARFDPCAGASKTFSGF